MCECACVCACVCVTPELSVNCEHPPKSMALSIEHKLMSMLCEHVLACSWSSFDSHCKTPWHWRDSGSNKAIPIAGLLPLSPCPIQLHGVKRVQSLCMPTGPCSCGCLTKLRFQRVVADFVLDLQGYFCFCGRDIHRGTPRYCKEPGSITMLPHTSLCGPLGLCAVGNLYIAS